MVLTISSPGSGDGKTFITSNIGHTFAEVGNRTLIIDADMRRGEAHHLFGFDRKPGLSDYLAGNCGVEEIIRGTGNDRLDMVPCGSRLSNAPELLASPRMGTFLAQMKARYEVILFDSPPLGAGVDPLVLATLSGSIVLVMRNGKTDRALAESKLELLDRLPVRLLGAILNDVDSSGVYRYYSYLPGYEATSEDDVPKALQPA
jgi:capsular exopolysaccharide synthesis family protein